MHFCWATYIFINIIKEKWRGNKLHSENCWDVISVWLYCSCPVLWCENWLPVFVNHPVACFWFAQTENSHFWTPTPTPTPFVFFFFVIVTCLLLVCQNSKISPMEPWWVSLLVLRAYLPPPPPPFSFQPQCFYGYQCPVPAHLLFNPCLNASIYKYNSTVNVSDSTVILRTSGINKSVLLNMRIWKRIILSFSNSFILIKFSNKEAILKTNNFAVLWFHCSALRRFSSACTVTIYST